MARQNRRAAARLRRLTPPALLLGLALAVTGCPFDSGHSKALVDLKNGTLVVLPFSTPNKSRFDTEVGATFGREVASLIHKECPEAKVVGPEGLPMSIDGQTLDKFGFQDLGLRLGADYLLVGEIRDLRAREPKSFKVLKGTMELAARVINVRTESIAWETPRAVYHYPPPIAEEPIPAREKDEEVVYQKVMHQAALGLLEVFTGPKTRDEQGFVK